ncbi:hypothetical protein EVG20_g11196 [Dentipellis fragilis]|uniref:CCHC-type domain-containing protein n=1 Tax=Dentipellis fragilis TaxID=205917 RepID=A0A4Y9XLU7_9AGAM|nr:hypothetical protein EVG20_g11196 [Dentipellis fragilis]
MPTPPTTKPPPRVPIRASTRLASAQSPSPSPSPSTTTASGSPKLAVTNAEQARNFLVTRELLPIGAAVTARSLSVALRFTVDIVSLSAIAQTIIASIAFMLDDLADTQLSDAAATAVVQRVDAHMITIASSISFATSKLEATNSKLESTLDDTSLALNTHLADLENSQKDLRSTCDSISQILGNHSSTLQTTQELSGESGYRDALLRATKPSQAPGPLMDPAVAQKFIARACQVLITLGSGSELQPNLTELKAKALSFIANADPAPIVDVNISDAHRLKNGDIVFQFNSKEAADWIRSPGISVDFSAAISETASCKARTFLVIIPFIPLSFHPESSGALRDVETSNSLPEGSITRARWIKAPERRSPTQICGHAFFWMSSAESANAVLRDGVIICDKKVYPAKQKKEPLLCFGCFRWGHRKAECTAGAPRCARCGSPPTDSCKRDTCDPKCLLCTSTAHTSLDRTCPAFLERCQLMDERYLENGMPYFPMEDPWTHYTRPVNMPRETRFPLQHAYVPAPKRPPPVRKTPTTRTRRAQLPLSHIASASHPSTSSNRIPLPSTIPHFFSQKQDIPSANSFSPLATPTALDPLPLTSTSPDDASPSSPNV